MGRLINPGAGEQSDRLTVLALKRLYGRDAGKDTAHFDTEWGALLAQIRSRTLGGVWFEQLLELGAVNAALWHAEDDLRTFRVRYGAYEKDQMKSYNAGDVEEVAQLAFRIQALNDRRADLIASINASAGDSATGAEKL